MAAPERVKAGELISLTTSGRTWNFEEAAQDESESYLRGKAASETVPVGLGGKLPGAGARDRDAARVPLT